MRINAGWCDIYFQIQKWNRELRACGGFPQLQCNGAETDFNLMDISKLTDVNFDEVMATPKLVVALFTQVILVLGYPSCVGMLVYYLPQCLHVTIDRFLFCVRVVTVVVCR